MFKFMVYVFGIDLPLLEILFFVSIIILIGIIILIFAYRWLKKYIEELGKLLLKREIHLVHSVEKLEEYIKRKLGEGVHPEHIKDMVKKVGWRDEHIEDAFSKAHKSRGKPLRVSWE